AMPAAAAPEPPPIPAAGAAAASGPASGASPAAPASPGMPTMPATPAMPRAPAMPATPFEPDLVTKAARLLKAWFFEGNVPVKLGVLVLLFGVAAGIKYAADAGWLVVPIELRLAGIAAGAIAL